MAFSPTSECPDVTYVTDVTRTCYVGVPVVLKVKSARDVTYKFNNDYLPTASHNRRLYNIIVHVFIQLLNSEGHFMKMSLDEGFVMKMPSVKVL